jgi:hypothetical protein
MPGARYPRACLSNRALLRDGVGVRRGYEEVGGTSCNPIPVPANAFLRSSGYDWQCERGYRQERDGCVSIVLPDNAYLTDDTSGSGWTCERGFSASSNACEPIAVPTNAYLTNADYGAAWACERGFVKIDDRCDAIVVPANAFLPRSQAITAGSHET